MATATGLIVSPFPQGGGIFPAGFVTPGASSGAWTVVTDQAYEGANSLGSAKVVSPVFNTPVNSDMTFVGDFVTGRIAFAYRISSYQEYGTFEFSIDGVAVVTDAGGESGWKIVSVPITAGSRTLRWRFTNLLNAPCNAGWDPPPAGGASAPTGCGSTRCRSRTTRSRSCRSRSRPIRSPRARLRSPST